MEATFNLLHISHENEISSRLKSRLARRDHFLKFFMRRDSNNKILSNKKFFFVKRYDSGENRLKLLN
jgi:hypothetical protein